MRRREFVALFNGTAVAWPLAARAQPGIPMRRIGVLVGPAEDDPESKARLAGFQEGLRSLGWSEGRNVHIDYRFVAGRTEQIQVLAKELVALQPDVILVQGTANTAAVQRESRAIPVVFVTVSDPIGSRFVANLARPSGNLTGLLMYEYSITGKWLAMLKEIAPHLIRVALLVSPTTAHDYFVQAAMAAVRSLAIELVPNRVENAAHIERVIETFARVPNGGLLLPPDNMTIVHRDLVIALAARHRLPSVYSLRVFVADGGLMSYAADRIDMFRNAASYVDRILRGAKPADLPVQAPTKYETTLNLKTAKALDLTVPPTLLAAADEVIE
jgi:putative tryptophan/tyrosine transport system substrate-binding protein